MQQVADLHQLATLYADSLNEHLPAGPFIIAGVGLCSMVAFELISQLQHRHKQPQLLTVFQSVPVSQARMALPVLDETLTSELVQVWCALYHLLMELQPVVGESGSSQLLGAHASASLQVPHQQLPELCSMVTHLHSLQSYEEQLEYISSFRPAGMEPQLWDCRVHETLSRVLHLMQLLHAYQPRESLGCPVIVVHELMITGHQGFSRSHANSSSSSSADSLAQVADDCWKQVAPALLPVMTCSMRAEADAAVSSAALVSLLDSLIVTVVDGSDVTPFEPARSGTQLAVAVPLNSLCVDSR